MIVAGCDVGALSAKAVVMEDGGVLGSEIIRVRPDAVLSATQVMDRLIGNLGLLYSDIDRCVSTGYGRGIVPFAQANLSEVSCHGRGATWLIPSVRTIIDGGGQDCKVLSVDKKGLLRDFRMTGKCGAGTGRALELMAESLGVDISEVGALSLRATRPAIPVHPCSVMAEIKIKYLVMEGIDDADIAAGITRNVAKNIMRLLNRFNIKKDIAITGGIAKNIGVVKQLEQMLDMEFVELPADPQLIGAIGAAVFASDQLTSTRSQNPESHTGMKSGTDSRNMQ
jgi:predicted CoA-substrate-specific enzyme activase